MSSTQGSIVSHCAPLSLLPVTFPIPRASSLTFSTCPLHQTPSNLSTSPSHLLNCFQFDQLLTNPWAYMVLPWASSSTESHNYPVQQSFNSPAPQPSDRCSAILADALADLPYLQLSVSTNTLLYHKLAVSGLLPCTPEQSHVAGFRAWLPFSMA